MNKKTGKKRVLFTIKETTAELIKEIAHEQDCFTGQVVDKVISGDLKRDKDGIWTNKKKGD